MKVFWKIYSGIFCLSLFAISSHAAGRQSLQGHVPAAASRLQPIGALAGSTNLQLAIGFSLRNQAELTNLLTRIYDPADPLYHHYLTPEQFAREFGPSEKDYETVAAFAEANGFTITTRQPNRMLLDVRGSVADIERAFHLSLRVYQHPTEHRTFYAPDTEPSLDLSVPILRISGLNNYSLPHPRFTAVPLSQTNNAKPQDGSGPQGTYLGNDFRAAYVPGTALTGAGQTVGLVQFDGYTPADITYYEALAGLPSVTLSNVFIDGFNGQPSGNGGEVEVSLDIEMAMSMAPGLSKIILYEAPNSIDLFDDVLNRMATDNAARQLSCSWFNPGGGPDPVADQIFQQMAAQGQSFLNASGDDDAWAGPIFFPGESPYITQVGGTTLTTDGAGGPWLSETVWNWGGLGSGGGISTDYPIPSWQTNVSMASNQGSTTMRNTPDVAMTADNVYVRADGVDLGVGGTSCAAPLWAGFTALVNQQAAAYGNPPPGFLNPTIYQIGLSGGYLAAFHDITTGDNTSSASPDLFVAVPGYDLCTGWGTPAGQGLIDALAPPPPATPPSIVIQPQDQTVPTASNAVFVVTATGSPVLDYQWSFNGTNINGATNASLLLLNVQPTQAGNYSVQITNSFGAVTSSNALLTVEPPIPPGIVTQPQDQTVPLGGIAVFSVVVTGTPPTFQWTFNGNPIAGATNNPLIVFNAQPSDVGTYAVQVTNAAAATVSSNASLSVLPPGTSCESDTNGLVGWWAAEGNAYNAVNGIYGGLDGGLNFVPGKVGQAFNFNGTDADVQNAPAATLNVSGQFTLEAWINPSEVAHSHPLIEWGHPFLPANGLMLWISIPPLYGGAGPGSLILDLQDIGFGELSTPPGFIQSNVWQHVAATYDSTSGIASLYINGSLITQTNFGAIASFTTEHLWFGYDPVSRLWGPSVFGEQARYAGQMDEILIYNRALSAAEIQATFSAGSYGLCPLPPTSVTIQPTNQSAVAGNTVTFTALPNGTPPLSYQWSFNGTNITGATTPTLTLTNVQQTQAGIYTVQVSNAAGSATSSIATLTVFPAFPAWTATKAPALSWRAVACSADGMKIVAVSASGQIYTSTNFGITWISNNVPSLAWTAVTCSADGTRMAAAGNLTQIRAGQVYGSTNSGASWQLLTNALFGALVGSADGSKLIGGDLYTSTNFGTTWNKGSSPGIGVKACSADALTVVGVGVNNHQVFVSTNFGATWNSGTTLTTTNDITQAACSSDGTRMVAAVYGGYIYRSTNSGATWTPITLYGNWEAIACSADGSKLVTALQQGFTASIYTSVDSGTTWSLANATNVIWEDLASSADGNKLIAAPWNPGPIYTWQLPTLYSSLSGNQLSLSWFTNAEGFTLQQNSDLSTTNWQNVTSPMTVTNWFNQVVVSPSGTQFYRLKFH